ncbi:MAG: cyclic nucleotide-binding domain-containing protein [Deltaproteobacteria bacterium]|nr:cyclic nucleotide-binding domain-containing protein [Deltaproteobacteria bacterium]
MNAAELRHVASLADFPDHDLEVLAGIGRPLIFPAGAVIIEQDERARAAYLLLDGEVEVFRRLPGGQRPRLAVLERGAILGAVALIDGGPRAASCHAGTEARVLELLGDDFQRLSLANTPLGARFLMAICRQLVRDLRGTNRRMAELAGLASLAPEDIASSLGGSLI